jgi:hypothetical protein
MFKSMATQVSDLRKSDLRQSALSDVIEVYETDNVDENTSHSIRGRFIGSETLVDNCNTTTKNSNSSSGSSSGINATKSLFLHTYLGKPVEQFGKAAVMSMSNGGSLPRFSKYSGVVEWRNAVYLWVNIGGKTGYRNSFSEEGRFIMWFGGSRMHAGECCLEAF